MRARGRYGRAGVYARASRTHADTLASMDAYARACNMHAQTNKHTQTRAFTHWHTQTHACTHACKACIAHTRMFTHSPQARMQVTHTHIHTPDVRTSHAGTHARHAYRMHVWDLTCASCVHAQIWEHHTRWSDGTLPRTHVGHGVPCLVTRPGRWLGLVSGRGNPANMVAY